MPSILSLPVNGVLYHAMLPEVEDCLGDRHLPSFTKVSSYLGQTHEYKHVPTLPVSDITSNSFFPVVHKSLSVTQQS